MNKLLSFLIPSYNVENYLPTCLDSFLCPSVLEQLEVIVVDDGSQDRTAEIARSYVRRFPSVFRLLQKENGGHGSAINAGSLAASGRFFKVIDADDWVVTDHLPRLLKTLETLDADVLLTPFHMVDMKTGERTLQRMYLSDYSRIYTPDELAADWKSFDRCATFHGILYRTDFYQKFRHELPEKVFYEDQEYATIPLCRAQRVAVLDLTVYQYLIGNSSQSVSHENQVRRIGHLEQVIFHMIGYWASHRTDPDFSEAYWLKKAEGTVLSYYVAMCIVNPDKRNGRRLCRRLNEKLRPLCPALYRLVRRKYQAYLAFSLLHVTPASYEAFIHSPAFRLLRRNHEIEKE